ncbi:MAG: type II secretion system major pseudopilin GspG [Candidatus Eremiobacteraeota bacterium]|nr:type II secretion system major pseudopilin GspG [Candidatus Eremiobacteraeota bacterium]
MDWSSAPTRKFFEHFTVPIMLIITLLTIPWILKLASEDNKTKAIIQMREISEALELYKKDNGQYPTTEQGLMALVERPVLKPLPKSWKPHLDMIPKDPWGNEYEYRYSGSDSRYSLLSPGKDRKRSKDDIISGEEEKNKNGRPSP